MKYTTGFRTANDPKAIHSNYTGNNTKSMYLSVEASLKKLRTNYIDVVSICSKLRGSPLANLDAALRPLVGFVCTISRRSQSTDH